MKHLSCVLTLVLIATGLMATETENHGISILPAKTPPIIDGDAKDWDLSGGVFVCSDVENLRGQYSSWFHLMYDQDNLYALARWNDDTPMNNPGSVAGDMGFQGDCLQFRVSIGKAGEPVFQRDEPANQRTTHVTAWRDRAGKDVIDLAWGSNFNQGNLKDAKSKGGAQGFVRKADGKGYVQELSIPWSQLAPEGWKPAAGTKIRVTVEPNFGTDAKLRITTKDVFKAGITIDRAFTFGNGSVWGYGTFAASGKVEPAPVRLSDAREFAVRLNSDGIPLVDWGGLNTEQKLEGFASLKFTLPEDGYVSLNVRNAAGQVVRQLLTANRYAKGENEVKWDGLTNTSFRKPGEVVPPGTYTWDAIWHKGLGLRLVGWACNSGRTPFDSPGGNWGGDMGCPISVTTTGDAMILGWGASEAGQAVVCTDLEGKVKWRHKRGGFGGAALVAAADGIVYVYDAGQGNTLYRLNQATGEYAPWQGSEEAGMNAASVLAKQPAASRKDGAMLSGLDVAAGKLWLTFGPRDPDGKEQTSADSVILADAATGKALKTISMAAPGDLEVGADGRVYVLSAGNAVLRLDPESGSAVPVVSGLAHAVSLALDKAGNIYVGFGDPDNQVKVFSTDGKALRSIGRPGGRPVTGPWQPDGMRYIAGLRIDAQDHLWVMENNESPRRISVWNTSDGAFVRELFGPTNYGAGGGAISPVDPLTVVGHGCEWKIDAATGQAACVGVFHPQGVANARFGYGKDNRLYLAVCGDNWTSSPVYIYERLTAGVYKLRTTISASDKKTDQGVIVWADANDDGVEQPDESKTYPTRLGGWINGWYMPFTQSMIFYGTNYRLAPVAWTACGAPVYDPSSAKRLPAPNDMNGRGGMSAQRGCGSEDGSLMVYNGHYGADHSDFSCWNITTGSQAWSYPNTFVGVHGGHNAPPPAVGLIRGAYDIVGSVKLPEPIGDVFVIGTDKGEWHLLTGSGYYLSSLFQPDGLKVQWPDPCVPGAVMDNTPPGMGSEDFGGSVSVTKDGQMYIQAGKTAFIDLKVVGLDAVQKLGSGSLTMSDADAKLAVGFRQKLIEGKAAAKEFAVKRGQIAFTGDVRKDFASAAPLTFTRSQSTVEGALAYDDANLYVGWSVTNDATPWINGATEPAVMYAKGDTVDLQLGTDGMAERTRAKPVLGDLRLSIGNPLGKGPVAVLYRPVATLKRPRLFYSGTVKEGYEMQSVEVLKDAKITVQADKAGRKYVIEAAIPLAVLGLTPKPGMKLSGDLGATYGNPAGDDTVVRSYWSNQATDFVADEVWELTIEPKNWGVFNFE